MPRIPKIGLTLDFENGSEKPGSFSKLDYFAIRDNYCQAVVDAGGMPIPLPHFMDYVDDYVAMLDGLIVTGGAFDVDPAMYNGGDKHATVILKQRRTAFEVAVLKAMLAQDKPVLGICGGQQLQNVVLGGTLFQHIPDSFPDCLEHEQPNPRHEPGHSVRIQPNSQLRQIVQADRLEVNSAHHQAVDQVGTGVKITASASDGVIEAIEHNGYKFCIGVQWHPEYYVNNGDKKLFKALVQACQN